METRTVTRSYTIQRDLDGDDILEDVVVTETLTVVDHDGNPDVHSAEELRLALESDTFTRQVTFSLSGTKGSSTDATFHGPIGSLQQQEVMLDALLDEVDAEARVFYAEALSADVAVTPNAFVPVDQNISSSDHPSSDCGPTALLMVLQAFGLLERNGEEAEQIKTLGDNMGTTGEAGSQYTMIEREAARMGLDVVEVLGPPPHNANAAQTLEDIDYAIQSQLALGRPVMLSVDFDTLMNVLGVEERGAFSTHYVVITGYADGQYTLQDPWTGTTYQVDRQDFNDALQSFQDVTEATTGIKGWNNMVVMSFYDNGDGRGSITDNTGADLTTSGNRSL